MTSSSLPFSPAADRNKQPILEALEVFLPAKARVLEIASGSGQHAQFFATAHPEWTWQPSDGDPACLSVIAQRCSAVSNVLPPRLHDLLKTGESPAAETYEAIFCANLLHISPWSSCTALMRHAASVLVAGGRLVVYGPFDVETPQMAPGNLSFDADLRARNPQWGIRRLGDVQAVASKYGLVFERQSAMPANNLMLIWKLAL